MIKRISVFLPLFYLTHSAYADTITPSDDSPIVVRAIHTVSNTAHGGSQTIVTREKIQMSGIHSLKQILQRTGALQLNDTTGNGSQASVSLRGFGANADSNSLILINGIPLTNPDLAPPNLNLIPLQDISRIVITQGSESVLYGDQAVGGVINILTDDGIEERGRLACHAGSYHQYGCEGSYTLSPTFLQSHFSAAADHTDNYRDHNDYDQQHAGLTMTYPYANGSLHADITLLNENMQYPGALTIAQVRQNRQQASNDIDYFKDLNGSLLLTDHHQLNEQWQLDAALARRQMSGMGVLFSSFTQSRTTDYFKPTIKGRLLNMAVTAGADFQKDDYELNSAFGLTKDSQQKYGLFALTDIPWRNKTTFTIGVRGAQQSSDLTSFTTTNNLNRALATTTGVSYQLTPNAQWTLRRAGSFRFPKADENASTSPGSTGLRTQRGMSYESGLQYSNDKQQASVNVYQLNLRDEIAFDPFQTAQTPFGSNQNLAPTQRRGLSASASQPLNSKLTLDGQYNLVSALFRSGIYEDKHIPLVASTILHLGLQYDVSDNWHLYGEALYTGSQYAANDYANVAGKVGGYTVYGMNVQYTCKQFNASLRADNITNKEYYFYSVYQNSGNTTFYYPAPTSNVMLTLAYQFV